MATSLQYLQYIILQSQQFRQLTYNKNLRNDLEMLQTTVSITRPTCVNYMYLPRYNECILFAVTRRVFLKPFRATVPLQRFSYHGFDRVKLLIKILKFQAYSLISKNTEPLETKVS